MKIYVLLLFFFLGTFSAMAYQEEELSTENTFGLYKSESGGLIDEPAPEDPATPDIPETPVGDGLYVLLGAAGIYVLIRYTKTKRSKLV